MTHPSQLQLSMHADNALAADVATEIAAHIDACTTCQTTVAALRDELGLITSALQVDPPGEDIEVRVPRFSRPASLRGFAMANLATGLVIWLAQFLWKTLFGELIVNATTWVTSVYLPDIYAMASSTALYLLEEGTVMFYTYLNLVLLSVFVLTVLGLALRYRRSRATLGGCLLMVMIGTMLVPAPATALDFRRDDVVTIGKAETIDDTLLIAAETVLIEGVVKGDVVAVGQRIDVSGTVEGNLLTFGESVTVSGKVGGLAMGGASSYDLRGATVGGDLWVGGERVDIDNEARIGRNAMVASENASVSGGVGKDLYAFGETVEFSGELGEDLEAFASRLRLLGDADISGSVRFRTRNEDRLHRADTVHIGGEVEFLDMPEGLEDRSRYATLSFYLWQVARLVAAFLVGFALLWLVPGFRNISLGAGVDALKTVGIGFLALVVVPIAAVLVGVTLVGLPLSLIAFAAFLLGLYLAKIAVAVVIGRMVLDSDSVPRTLLAGLGIVIVAVNIPFIGGVISFVLTLVGLGLLVQWVFDTLPRRSSDESLQG